VVRIEQAKEAGMPFNKGDRVRLQAGGEAMEVVRLLENGEVECCRPANPDQGATGLVTRHPGAALQAIDGPSGSDGLRAETEPSDTDLGPARPRTVPTTK
jgi:hypothetical protein